MTGHMQAAATLFRRVRCAMLPFVALSFGCVCLSALDARADGDTGMFVHPQRYDTGDFWSWNSVLYAEIITGWTNGPDADSGTILIRPLGTLSGKLDPGTRRELRLSCRSQVSAKPGDKVIVAILNTGMYYSTPPTNPRYVVQFDWWAAWPKHFNPFVIVSGLSDPAVRETLAVIQELRHKPPLLGPGLAGYWQQHSVVYAEVADEASVPASPVVTYRFRIIGTVSGTCDVGKTPEVSLDLDSRRLIFLFDERFVSMPTRGDMMLLLLKRDGSHARWHVAEERSEFMPFAHDPLIHVSRSMEPRTGLLMREVIDGTLSRIQGSRRGEGVQGASPAH